MLTLQKKTLAIMFVAFAIAVAALSFASARKAAWPPKVSKTQTSGMPQSTVQGRRLYVRGSALWPQLRWNLKALGDRLQRPGKEQVIMTGNLTRAGVSAPVPVALNIEAPNRMTLTTQTGLQTQVIQFDGTDSSWAALPTNDRDFVETLFFDTAENFFFGQMKGSATRSLGFRFQLSDSNSFYDLYEVSHHGILSGHTKLFCFNSDTLLLDIVRYQIVRNGISVPVEIRLSDWREAAGQKVAHRIDRMEGNTTVMTLTINTVVFAPTTEVTQQGN